MAKGMMKRQEMSQEQFNHVIELLIIYKNLNPSKDVFLSEESIKDSFQWYQTMMKGININPEMVKQVQSQLKNVDNI